MASVQQTLLLDGIVAAHAYVGMFLDFKFARLASLFVNHWGSDQGNMVLKELSQLYVFLVWEIIVLETISRPESSGDEIKVAEKDLELLKVSTSASQGKPSGQTTEGSIPAITV